MRYWCIFPILLAVLAILLVRPSPAKKAEVAPLFAPPLSKAKERVTKKVFSGYYKDRFVGYHTGTDFEIFPEELSADIPVRAICSGNLALREWASGYGGVAVQNCELAGSPITVVYGHLKLESIASGNLKIGDRVGILGADHSAETDGERKHLHLGIHKGTVTNIAGYVVDQANLTAWLDPCSLVCQN